MTADGAVIDTWPGSVWPTERTVQNINAEIALLRCASGRKKLKVGRQSMLFETKEALFIGMVQSESEQVKD